MTRPSAATTYSSASTLPKASNSFMDTLMVTAGSNVAQKRKPKPHPLTGEPEPHDRSLCSGLTDMISPRLGIESSCCCAV